MEKATEQMPSIIRDWQSGYEALWNWFGPCFRYKTTRAHGERYVRGLLGRIERKNGWQLAEYLGDRSPYAVQNFLARAAWNADDARDVLMRYAREHMLAADENGVLIVDETGFLKKGEYSAGVARQYSGTAGRIENSQIGVFLTLAGSRGRCLIDRELYLTKDWCDDGEKRKKAHIPEEVTFQTKPQLAIKMLERAYKQGIRPDWVLGDSVYGCSEFRNFLINHRQKYVLSVTGQQRLWVNYEQVRIDKIVKSRPANDWSRHSAGKGTKGERFFDWISWPIAAEDEAGFRKYALARRSIANPEDYAYYFCYAPGGTSTEDLAKAAGKRWNIECCFETAKQETGLDEYEIRSFHGWYRHITLSMIALAYLSAAREASQIDEAEKKGSST